jgi:polyisoprenoid-binding protein YceI
MVTPTRYLLALLMAATLLSPWSAPTSAERRAQHYTLDLSDAEVNFSVNVLGLFRVSGRFEQVQGGLLFSEACTAKSIAFSIQTASVNTDNPLRDEVIRSPALLNSRAHPFITFSSTHIDSPDGRPGRITGTLGMNGRSREVSFILRPGTAAEDVTPEPDGYVALASISRADFGIPSPMPGTSDTIRIQVTLELREDRLTLASSATQENTP